jgi:hypothetical protein
MDKDYIKMLSTVEQFGEFLTQNLPPLWWGFYQNCMKSGFTEEQAMLLVKQYIHSSVTSAGNLRDIGDADV